MYYDVLCSGLHIILTLFAVVVIWICIFSRYKKRMVTQQQQELVKKLIYNIKIISGVSSVDYKTSKEGVIININLESQFENEPLQVIVTTDVMDIYVVRGVLINDPDDLIDHISNLAQPISSDRILHMTELCANAMPDVIRFAKKNDVLSKLRSAFRYLRTYTGGSEREWKSELHLDLGFNPKMPSFTCAVCRRIPQEHSNMTGLRLFMLIGMIWDDSRKEWSFHS